MTANELRTMYVNFFKERGHKEIASASLLPENDPTVLFTTAGMHHWFRIYWARSIQVERDLQMYKNV